MNEAPHFKSGKNVRTVSRNLTRLPRPNGEQFIVEAISDWQEIPHVKKLMLHAELRRQRAEQSEGRPCGQSMRNVTGVIPHWWGAKFYNVYIPSGAKV